MAPEGRAQPQPPWGPPPEILDFRSMEDEAWYSVVVRSEEEGRVLRVMYTNFSAKFDEKYSADEFESEEELEEFGKRFRRGSVQLQDSECVKVTQGTQATVAHVFSPEDTRFYDAIIESVNSKVHPPDEGKCICTFVVSWRHGPLVGKRTSTGIENICLLQPKNLKMDPTVMKFLDIARRILVERKSQEIQTAGCFQKNSRQDLENDLAKSGGHSSYTGQPKCAVDYRMQKRSNSSVCLEYDVLKINGDSFSSLPCGSPIGSRLKKSRYSLSKFKDKDSSKKTDANMRHTHRARRSSQDMSVVDIDLGSDISVKRAHSMKTLYFFRIENLEMDISAFDVMDFILEKASLISLAFICPSVLEKFCSRATILVETEEEANKLYEFLHDSSHIITSSGGRPWLTDENWYGSLDGIMPRYDMPSRNRRKEHPSKIKLVYKGTEEYERAKLQQALHVEFHYHVQKNLLPELMEAEKRYICEQLRMRKTTNATTDNNSL